MITATRIATVGFAAVLLLAPVACSGTSEEASAPEASPADTEAPAEAVDRAPHVAIRNARLPLPDVLTGGQPTPEQIDEAAGAGYRTIVNTRSSAEEGFEWEADRVADAGMRYVFIETPGADGLTRENVERLAELLADPEARPMMIHCGSGNRVGALLALKAAWVDGQDDEAALQVGLDAGLTRLEEATRHLLAQD